MEIFKEMKRLSDGEKMKMFEINREIIIRQKDRDVSEKFRNDQMENKNGMVSEKWSDNKMEKRWRFSENEEIVE